MDRRSEFDLDDGDAAADTLAAQIAARLRDDILLDKLKPGAPIKEREKAEELGVSRTPMREAIRILAAQGLVVLRPSRSSVVANPSLRRIADDIAVICALETLSGRLACAEATQEEIDEIARMHERMVAESDTAGDIDFFTVDMAFHSAIARASRNRSLIATHQEILGRLWRARFLSARIKRERARVLRQHAEIAAGLAARDPDRVAPVIESHFERMVRNISEAFDEAADAGPDAGPDARAGA